MRLLICAVVGAGALLGQEATPPPKDTPAPEVSIKPLPKPLSEEQKRALVEQLKNRLQRRNTPAEPGAVTLATGQPCAIPLKNVLPPTPPTGEPARIKVIPPPPGRFPMRDVTVPAPSCDDVKR